MQLEEKHTELQTVYENSGIGEGTSEGQKPKSKVLSRIQKEENVSLPRGRGVHLCIGS